MAVTYCESKNKDILKTAGCAVKTPHLPAVWEAMVCTHQFICCLRVLIKEKWCEAFSWVNAYYTTRVGNGVVR